ncbi:thiamine pyrophosphate-dependent enzyme [Candidatus Tremblaya phenacola]|uniref:Acetolactate synthase isozyme 3 large subunit n=1 Tax=Candidatus Tremblayella phenacoccinincola TaxID=1010676 RepID=A0A2G0V746_9PROT|nr:thiamine pyrophosphate-dependent enzyme [Candidatus Tremblaya phenacola]PHN16289.1 Acetolactate synthase isozyme 3 large subunit [Candidatus Tremblaya phenacola]
MDKKSKQLSIIGASVLVEVLSKTNINPIWGYPGGSVLNVYDELYKQPKLTHVLVRNEQTAVYAASISFKLSKKPGICLVTSGPGITNAITGIVASLSDSHPLLILSGQVPLKTIGKQAFQECDTVNITRTCTKRNFLIRRIQNIHKVLKEAMYVSNNNKTSPVLADFPKSVSKTLFVCLNEIPPQTHDCFYKREPLSQCSQQLKQCQNAKASIIPLSSHLSASNRPLLYIGGGLNNYSTLPELKKTLNSIGAPSTNTLMNFGTQRTRFNLGMLGMHGKYFSNLSIHYCDLLIAVGSRFDDRAIGNINHFNSIPRSISYINVDLSIKRSFKFNVVILEPIKHTFRNLISLLTRCSTKRIYSPWLHLIKSWKHQSSVVNRSLVSLKDMFYVLEKTTRRQAIICSDVGQHQMWVAQHFNLHHGKWLNSGGLGAMGSGLSFALGAKVIIPKADVVCFIGDGSIQMNLQEFSTLKQLNAPITVLILNNKSLGMVKQWQRIEHNGRFSQSTMKTSVNFTNISRSYGHFGLRLGSLKRLVPTFIEAVNQKGCSVVLDISLSEHESVWPMVQSGKGITNMLLRHTDVN